MRIESTRNPAKGYPIILKLSVISQLLLTAKMQTELPTTVEHKMENKTAQKDAVLRELLLEGN